MVTDPLPVPPNALSLIRSFEGCRLTAYPGLEGELTIGWGHCGEDVTEGLQWSQDQADAALLADAQAAYDSVCSLISMPLNDNQASALTDFVYNLGAGALQKSTLRVLLNQGRYDEVPAQILRWCKDKQGNVINGLLRRRQAEVDMWNEPV